MSLTFFGTYNLTLQLSRIDASPNGWTDNDFGMNWVAHSFAPQTRTKLEEKHMYHLLILDGQMSYCSFNFIAEAERAHIIVLCLPPHTTHILQPCDVGMFGLLASHYWKIAMETA